MPPKKKGSAKKKKKREDGELTIDDKYKRTLDEIEALKDHLAMRKELARRSQTAGDEWKERMLDAEKTLEQQASDHKQVHSGMARQYKEMERGLVNRIEELQINLHKTQKQLASTEEELEQTKKEMTETIEAKDQQIQELENNLKTMEKTYDKAFKDSLDHLEALLVNSQGGWTKASEKIQAHNKKLMLELGLNPLDI